MHDRKTTINFLMLDDETLATLNKVGVKTLGDWINLCLEKRHLNLSNGDRLKKQLEFTLALYRIE